MGLTDRELAELSVVLGLTSVLLAVPSFIGVVWSARRRRRAAGRSRRVVSGQNRSRRSRPSDQSIQRWGRASIVLFCLAALAATCAGPSGFGPDGSSRHEWSGCIESVKTAGESGQGRDEVTGKVDAPSATHLFVVLTPRERDDHNEVLAVEPDDAGSFSVRTTASDEWASAWLLATELEFTNRIERLAQEQELLNELMRFPPEVVVSSDEILDRVLLGPGPDLQDSECRLGDDA